MEGRVKISWGMKMVGCWKVEKGEEGIENMVG